MKRILANCANETIDYTPPARAKGLVVIFSKQPNINRIPHAFIEIFNNDEPELNPITYIVNSKN